MKKFKNLKDVFAYLTFSSPNGDVTLSVNWDNEQGIYYAAFLSIDKINLFADNDEWLFGTFYKAIKKYNKLRKENAKECFQDVDGINNVFIEWITKEKSDDILEMLKAVKQLNYITECTD